MNIITRIRKSYITKGLALMLALNMLFEFVWPTAAMALTTGPSQPEVQSFEPVETTDMVNLFTGDFTYNIPLMNVPGPNGGYPINLAYHAGITMDQEASWVGLGWNINAGAINRQVRGVPDDFDGDKIVETQDIKDNFTVGLSVSPCVEIFGADGCTGGDGGALLLSHTYYYNNFKGIGYTLDPSISFGSQPRYSFGLSIDPNDGVGFDASLSLKTEGENQEKEKYA
ncbi:MAG: hypothetical protein MI810_22670, partial [Flavobacteriales bacterium]|nr:hypothetical protein [Flavobacteriales bacterium]